MWSCGSLYYPVCLSPSISLSAPKDLESVSCLSFPSSVSSCYSLSVSFCLCLNLLVTFCFLFTVYIKWWWCYTEWGNLQPHSNNFSSGITAHSTSSLFVIDTVHSWGVLVTRLWSGLVITLLKGMEMEELWVLCGALKVIPSPSTGNGCGKTLTFWPWGVCNFLHARNFIMVGITCYPACRLLLVLCR